MDLTQQLKDIFRLDKKCLIVYQVKETYLKYWDIES